MKRAIETSSRKIYRWLRHPRHRKRSKFRNWLAEKVSGREMWTHPSAHTFAGGLAVGLAVGMVIVPFQMVIAAIICCFLRFHIPVSVVAVWISNPFTWAPCYAFEHWVGKWIYRLAGSGMNEAGGISEDAIIAYTGAAFCALAAAAIGYPAGLWFGRRIVARREARREEQLELARKRAAEREALATSVAGSLAKGE